MVREIVRAFGLAFLVLSAILAATAAVVIAINMIIGSTLYITGSANHDMGALSYILVAALTISVCRRWLKNRATNSATVPQADPQTD